MKSVVVGSRNPVKIAAAKNSIGRFLGEPVEADGIDVASGVSDQPMTDEETRQGATARSAAVRRLHPGVDFAVGIEGGIEVIDGDMFAFAWVVIDCCQARGRSRSAAFLLPPMVRDLVKSGVELGHANDQLFSQVNSKQKGGAVGILTAGAISRQDLYEHAADLALIPLCIPTLFADKIDMKGDFL
jgi:inosine/xanthosine triphosphatase